MEPKERFAWSPGVPKARLNRFLVGQRARFSSSVGAPRGAIRHIAPLGCKTLAEVDCFLSSDYD